MAQTSFKNTSARIHAIIDRQVALYEKLSKGDALLSLEDISRLETIVKTLAILSEKIKDTKSNRWAPGEQIKKEKLLEYALDESTDSSKED